MNSSAPTSTDFPDEAEILKVVASLAQGVDLQDLSLVRSCFHPHATDDHGRYRGSVDGFIVWLAQQLSTALATTHLLSDSLVQIDGDFAMAETYCLAMHVDRDRPEAVRELAVRYCDRFERRDGEWKIVHRQSVFDAILTPVVPIA